MTSSVWQQHDNLQGQPDAEIQIVHFHILNSSHSSSLIFLHSSAFFIYLQKFQQHAVDDHLDASVTSRIGQDSALARPSILEFELKSL